MGVSAGPFLNPSNRPPEKQFSGNDRGVVVFVVGDSPDGPSWISVADEGLPIVEEHTRQGCPIGMVEICLDGARGHPLELGPARNPTVHWLNYAPKHGNAPLSPPGLDNVNSVPGRVMIAVGSGTSLSCSGFCRPESAGLGVWTAGSSEVPNPFRRVAAGWINAGGLW
jgi:hypothetical protein